MSFQRFIQGGVFFVVVVDVLVPCLNRRGYRSTVLDLEEYVAKNVNITLIMCFH